MAIHRIETSLSDMQYEKLEEARGTIPRSAFLREMIHWTLVATDEEIEMVEKMSRKML